MLRSTRIIVVTILASVLTSCGSSPNAQSGSVAPPPVPVGVATAVEESVPIQVRAVGTVEAVASVGVKAQIGGPLLSVKFAEGANVKQGDLLFEIDPRPFAEALRHAEAAVRQNEADLRVAEANIARARAQQKNAEAEAARFQQLSKEGISTRMQDDEIRTAAEVAALSVRAAEASLESIRAGLDRNRSAVEQAKINLSYTRVNAPISGRTGNVLLHPGNLVTANGEDPLVVINQISPTFVTFGVPERYLGSIAQENARRKLPVEATSGDDSGKTARGTLAVIDNTVDPATGTIRLKGAFDNVSGQLWPGQFVNVVLTLDVQRATVIPSEAIQAGQQGSFVYVMKMDSTVEPRPLEIGQTTGGKAVVISGVMPGESVVIEGQSRLYPGAKVVTSDSQPGPSTSSN